jgi:uncharacterized membrane protein YesL
MLSFDFRILLSINGTGKWLLYPLSIISLLWYSLLLHLFIVYVNIDLSVGKYFVLAFWVALSNPMRTFFLAMTVGLVILFVPPMLSLLALGLIATGIYYFAEKSFDRTWRTMKRKSTSA